MPYRHAIQDQNYSDLSAGRVLYSLPGAPAFPVRLASEIFLRARAHFGSAERICLYDPTCGGAYHLTALGFLHGEAIHTILASDPDEDVLGLARRNLSLLSVEGLSRRETELREMQAAFGKASHASALYSAAALREQLAAFPPVQTRCFTANALELDDLRRGLADAQVDLVISDVPYGQLSHWQMPPSGSPTPQDPLWQMLDALLSVLPSRALAAIAADKRQKIAHPGFQRIERFQVGKRQVVILQPKET